MMFISRSGLTEHYPASNPEGNKAYADKFCQKNRIGNRRQPQYRRNTGAIIARTLSQRGARGALATLGVSPARDLAGFINGQNIRIDGGAIAYV